MKWLLGIVAAIVVIKLVAPIAVAVHWWVF